MSVFSNPIFHDEGAARAWLEARLWPDGPVCPHCRAVDQATVLRGKNRPGLYQCRPCRKQFTVRIGTIYERSHAPLRKWLAATHLMMASKKGMSALQISRMIGVTYKTAWFMGHRIRESLRVGDDEKFGGESTIVEFDETFIGGRDKNRHSAKRRRQVEKEPVVALVERGGRVRSEHVSSVNAKTLRAVMTERIRPDTFLMTDEARSYQAIGQGFETHQSVNHTANEYVRGIVHTNTIESHFSLLKRGINGTFHHVSRQHLKRYLAEFDFRYNSRKALGFDDSTRFELAVAGVVGKRLSYKAPAG